MNSRDGVVGIMTTLDGPVLESRQVQSFFYSPVNHPNRLLGPHIGYRGLLLRRATGS
jgi:hypothetical protein